MVYNLTHGRRITPQGSMPDTASIDVIGSLDYVKISGVWVPKLPFDLAKTATQATLAQFAALNLYTVTALKIPLLAYLSFSASVAGFYTAQYAGVAIFNAYLGVGAQFIYANPDGLLLTTVAGLFRIVNNGPGAADVAGSIVLAEYTA